MPQKEINIARISYDAYPHADLLPIDPDQDCRNLQTLLSIVTGENIGDGLFKFMVIEIIEGGESTLDGAIRVMKRAREDVEAVLQALRTASVNSKQCISKWKVRRLMFIAQNDENERLFSVELGYNQMIKLRELVEDSEQNLEQTLGDIIVSELGDQS